MTRAPFAPLADDIRLAAAREAVDLVRPLLSSQYVAVDHESVEASLADWLKTVRPLDAAGLVAASFIEEELRQLHPGVANDPGVQRRARAKRVVLSMALASALSLALEDASA